MQVEQFEGMIFRTASGDEFGVIRALSGPGPEDLQALPVAPFAEDSCGNYFVTQSELIRFWDHETSELLPLANSIAEFFAGLVVPEPVELDSGQVRSVWIDPEFAKTLGGDPEANGP